MKHFLFIIFIFLLVTNFRSQSKVSSKLYAKELKLANSAFDAQDYLNAINLYRQVIVIDAGNETANLNALISRLKLLQHPDSMIAHVEYLKNSEIPEVQFYKGRFYHLQTNFNEAINQYNAYIAIPIKERVITDAEVNYYLGWSKNAIDITAQPHRSVIKNLGTSVNSPYPDYVPLITPDERVLYFTSRREGSTGNLKDGDGGYYEDVYMSVRPTDAMWNSGKNIGAPINTNTHDACVALSFDGNQMIIYRTAADKVSGDLYITRMGFTGWTEPEKLGSQINTPYIETSACFSTDTSVIYFSSNKPGGLGGKDIYRVKKLPNGKWSMPMNLGPTINTDKDDDSPFLHPDGTTLYFSSKGHNSMGEYDVFKTILNPELNTFSTPENLGSPINTVNNDAFFVLNANGTHGYYSSVKDDSYGESDIYLIDTRFGDNDLKVKQGRVMFGNEVSKAKITLIDIESKQVSGIYNANSKTGKFLLVMNPLKYYKAIVEEDGFETMIIDIQPLVDETTDLELILTLTKK